MNTIKKQSKSNSLKQSKAPKKNSVLTEEISTAIASKIIPTIPTPVVAERIKQRLVSRVKSENHTFIFANQGEWKNIANGVEIKLLHKTNEAKSFLIRMAANASISEHDHTQDEESFVIDGEVWLEGILCRTGDYHYARAGSRHERIHTNQGCTLLVRSI